LDSIVHELELKELQLQQLQSVEEVYMVEAMEMESLEMMEAEPMIAKSFIPSNSDTIFIHETIYIDSFQTVKETIIELEVMTEKDKADLKKKRAKNKHRKSKFR